MSSIICCDGKSKGFELNDRIYLMCHLQGLALINGTQMITSLGAEAVERAESIARQADIIAALTLEVLKGTTKAFDSGEKLIF